MSVDLETYKRMVEYSPDAILIMIDLKIVYANKTALEIYGADSSDELVGKDALSLGILTISDHGRTQELEMRRIQGYLESGVFEFPATLKDGSKAYFEVSVNNIPYEGKTGALCIIRDITGRKEIENRLQTLHESTALLAKATTPDKAAEIVLETISETFEKHYSAIGFVEGNKLVFRNELGDNLVNELPLDGNGITVRAIKTGETQVVNDVLNDPDFINGKMGDEPKTRSELDVPVMVDQEPVALITIEEEKLDAFSIEEIQMVEILANHFASALGRIKHHEDMLKMRESHMMELVGGLDKMCMRVREDLKGPIHSIRNSSFIIRHNPELTSEVIDNIDNSIELMMTTLEEMKEITNPTEPEKTLTDIYSVLNAAIDVSNIPRNIELEMEVDSGFLAISIDKEKIQRTFFNIIRNSIEAMPKGGKITIDHGIRDEYVVITFKDTGPGIPEDVLDKLYEPFFSTKPQSLGLGLSFCKLAVESNGGTIDIESELDQGTTVTIRLPL